MIVKREPVLLLTNTYLIQYILVGPAGQLLLWGDDTEADKCIQILADGYETIHRMKGGVAIGNHCEAKGGGSR